MKPFILLCLLACLLSLHACKPATSEQQDEVNVTATDTTPGASQTTTTASGGHDYAYLTDKMLHYKAANTAGKDTTQNEYENQWIDLDPDGEALRPEHVDLGDAGKLRDLLPQLGLGVVVDRRQRERRRTRAQHHHREIARVDLPE